VGATLTLDADDIPLATDDYGNQYDDSVFPPFMLQALEVWQQQPILFFGSPNSYFHSDPQFTVASPNPVADLTVPAGGSVHLVLGTITTLPVLPAVTYTEPSRGWRCCGAVAFDSPWPAAGTALLLGDGRPPPPCMATPMHRGSIDRLQAGGGLASI
jgi:hypothetical protein